VRTLILLHQFLDDVRAQKLRTTLTVLGITWGTVAVVVLLAFGTGLAEQMRRNARGMGEMASCWCSADGRRGRTPGTARGG